jgi:hypothetical protein
LGEHSRERRARSIGRPDLDYVVPQRLRQCRLVAEARSGFGCHISRGDLFAAVGADQTWIGELAAGVVAQHNRWRFGVRQVLVPLPHHYDDRPEEIAACLGEPVLAALGILRIWHPVKKA